MERWILKTSFWFEYIENSIDPELIRALSQLDDSTLKLSIAALICSIAGGLRHEIPSKTPQTEFAKRMIRQNVDKKKIIELTGISRAWYYKLAKRQTNG